MSAQGWASIPRWLLYSATFTPHAKLVYTIIQSHTDERGTAYPSQGTIARESGLSLASVKRALAQLTAAGLVKSTPRSRADGGQAASLYLVSAVLPPVDKPGESGG